MTFSIAPLPIVLDASVVVDVLLMEPRATRAWRNWLATDRMLLAPPMVWPEVANVLLRRRSLPGASAMVRLDLLFEAGLETADRGYGGIATAVDLAERHGLSIYDASYLALAVEIDASLATMDRKLAQAAEGEGVPLALKLDD